MTDPGSDIIAALLGDGRIPSEKVVSLIDAASDSDLPTLSKLYRLADEGYDRIQPDLGMEKACALIQRYLLGCIREGVNDNGEIKGAVGFAISLGWATGLPHSKGRRDGRALLETKSGRSMEQLAGDTWQ